MILRHQTAISRRDFSKPMRLAMEKNLIRIRHLDFGCGRGGDVTRLRELGFKAVGYDPHWNPMERLLEGLYGTVSLVFVLNVIEDPEERKSVLRRAWDLSEHGLLVAVRTDGKNTSDRGELYGDGIVTSRGTFQHFYTHKGFEALVAEVIPEGKIRKLDSGIVWVSPL